jgi:aspartate-semialdehyde dehydrogenase
MQGESMSSSQRVPVAVLGATGSVGQRFISLLDRHPWFDLVALTASHRSEGKAYREAARWIQTTPIPERVADMRLLPSKPPLETPIVFSALDASVAYDIERDFAASGALVVSNAKSHRMEKDVPLIVPEVNPDHIEIARGSRYSPGAILTNPNCSTIGLVIALKPIWDRFGLRRVSVATMQAISGAGLPGVASYEIFDNVIPFISGEEEKLESETQKILGKAQSGHIVPATITLSAQCHRVPVVDGHLLAVSVELENKVGREEMIEAWESFTAEPQSLRLPTAPSRPIYYWREDAAPQPRLHRDLDGGMAVSIGRLRPCSILDYKFACLSHNTVRGAAGGALLLAELAVQRGLLQGVAKASMTTG